MNVRIIVSDVKIYIKILTSLRKDCSGGVLAGWLLCLLSAAVLDISSNNEGCRSQGELGEIK